MVRKDCAKKRTVPPDTTSLRWDGSADRKVVGSARWRNLVLLKRGGTSDASLGGRGRGTFSMGEKDRGRILKGGSTRCGI